MKLRHEFKALILSIAVLFCSLCSVTIKAAESISMSVRDTELFEVMEMLSIQGRTNILMSDGVSARVSVNLFDVEFDKAIRIITNAAGYEVELRDGSYFIIAREDVGQFTADGNLMTRTFRLQYTTSTAVRLIIEDQLSSYGTVTELEDRNLLVVRDTPAFVEKIAALIEEVDYRPKQILIEARILEVTLDESEVFGVEWSKIFDNGLGVGGTQGLSGSGAGFFVDYVSNDLSIFLDALQQNGRTKTLSTPKLLVLENQPASVIVGDRLGYVNTVTINQVTSENTEFLESGVILEVTASVGQDDKIVLDIHPEISTGTVTGGVPSQTTTSVRTQLLIPSGGTSFIGGLIKSQVFSDERGVPGLRKIPLAGKLFSRDEDRKVNTEIIVLITPTLIDTEDSTWQRNEIDSVNYSITESAKHSSRNIPVVPTGSDKNSGTSTDLEQSSQE